MSRRASTLWLFVTALVFAPALASIWPALGKGPMLYTGTPPAHAAPHHGGAAAEAGSTRQASGDHAGHANPADDVAHAAHDAAGGAPATHGDHTRHCALCVLVSLAWAPVVHIAGGADAPPDVRRHAVAERPQPQRLVVGSRALARAPPPFS